MGPDIGEARAKQLALDHLHKVKGIKSWVQGIKRDGASYVVRLVPETKWGMLLFFVTYECQVNAQSGAVEKCE
jgi:hypothetical protein